MKRPLLTVTTVLLCALGIAVFLLMFRPARAAVGAVTDIQFWNTGAATCDMVQAQVFITGFVFTVDDGGDRDYGRITLQDGVGNTLGTRTFFKTAGDIPSTPGSYVSPILLTGISARPVRAILEDIDDSENVVSILGTFSADPGAVAAACANLPYIATGSNNPDATPQHIGMVCTDNRVNCEPWATAILYCQPNGVHVYGVNDDSSGVILFVATFETIDALGVPERNSLIASGAGPQGSAALYRLTTGEFQLVADDFQPGKWYNFIWAGCARQD